MSDTSKIWDEYIFKKIINIEENSKIKLNLV